MIALYNGLNMLKVLGYKDQEIEDAWTRTVSLIVEGTTNGSLEEEKILTPEVEERIAP